MNGRSNRLEWISLVYLLIFVLAVLSPSIYTRSFFGLSETTLEELTIFAFGLAGLVIFTLYERVMEKRERESRQVQDDYQRAKGELIESYAYIGSMNRKLELLKKLADDTSHSIINSKRFPKELFQALTANACASIGAEEALLRFVGLEKLRTEREFAHPTEAVYNFHVANKQLRTLHDQAQNHAFVRSDDKKEVLVIPSDRRATYQAFLLLRLAQDTISEVDVSLLKVFVNQAEMLYHHFAHPSAKEAEADPQPIPMLDATVAEVQVTVQKEA